MSVPKWRRNSSKLDTFYEAVKFRNLITQMILRSYGLKAVKKRPLITDKVRGEYPELAKAFKKIDEYQRLVDETKLLSKYDEWIVRKTRENLFQYSSALVANIAKANEMRCTFTFEYRERILLQDRAISFLFAIEQEVNFVEEFFDIDLNRYMEYDEKLQALKKMLYNWKRSTVKDYRNLLKEEKEWEESEDN